jgi:hypothetical protein
LNPIRVPNHSEQLNVLVSPIDAEEVIRAAKRCKKDKAHGPDELNNDWFRDYLDRLLSILLRLFNRWYSVGLVPDSFLQAHVYCLKKSKTAAHHSTIAQLLYSIPTTRCTRGSSPRNYGPFSSYLCTRCKAVSSQNEALTHRWTPSKHSDA